MGGCQPERHPSWQRKANHGYLWVDSNLRDHPSWQSEGQPWPSMGGFQPERHPSWERKANHGHLWVDANLRDIPPERKANHGHLWVDANLRDTPPGKGRPTMDSMGEMPTLRKEGQPWPSMGGSNLERRKANHGHLWVDANLRDIPPGKGRPTMAIYGWIPT